jgi:phosphatidylserine decarboxylase
MTVAFLLPSHNEKSRLAAAQLIRCVVDPLCHGVLRFVGADPGGHLVLQLEFSLLQRFLFELFIEGDLVLGYELAEARLACVMLIEPLAELFVFGAENPLNVSDLIRHPLSSFEVPSLEIVALCAPPIDHSKSHSVNQLRLQFVCPADFAPPRMILSIGSDFALPSATMSRLPWAPEGWLFLIPVLILTAAALLIQWTIAAIVLGLLAIFLLNFFRDPSRTGSDHHVDVLSPADGTVVQIKDIPDGDIWPGLTRQVSIFMSVFDVHVNRAPISGKIIHYRYNPGKKIAAFAEKSSTENEQNLIVVEDKHGAKLAFKQIAGLLARRIVFDKKEGDEVMRGERVGMIKFGSRVDMFFPADAVIKVGMRDKVKVGLTIVAELGAK